MDAFIEILKLTLPGLLVLYAVFLVVKSFLSKQFQSHLSELKLDSNKTTLPLRLQAYERMAIFLERITPNNLILRLNDNSYNASQLQHILVNEIREEFNHNLSQQIYMSDESWNMVKQAMESVITLVNNSAKGVGAEEPSIKLARKIFENVLENETDYTAMALKYLKQEIRSVFQ